MYSSADRTTEYMHIVNSLKTSLHSQQNGHIPSKGSVKTNRQQLIKQRSTFTNAAKQITVGLSSTCVKLEKLGILVKTTSLFDDKSQEIQELNTMIKEDISKMTQEIAFLNKVCSSQHSYNDTQSGRHTRSIVQTVQTKLNTMSQNFNEMLQKRVESLKKQAERREMFAKPSNANGIVNYDYLTNPKNKLGEFQPKMPSLLLEEEQLARYSNQPSKMVHSHSSPLFTQQIQLIDRTDDYLQSRSESIQEVERTIIDMGKIFEQLSILIHEQGEQVDMIHTNVEESSINVESGHNELLKFYQSVTSNRWLMIKIFGVLIVFVIVFVVLLA